MPIVLRSNWKTLHAVDSATWSQLLEGKVTCGDGGALFSSVADAEYFVILVQVGWLD